MAMNKARELFKNMDIPVEDNGMVSRDLSNGDIEKLKQWYKQTKVNGIQMPTEDAFYENVLLAVSLFPQSENGNINYLFGKGIGIEVALRGEVNGRKKKEIEFPYRTHSDFEMYGMDGECEVTFKEIFGAQERYSTTKTKGLKDIETGKMHENAEEVNLDGVTVLIPQLEMLFLDKYLKQEATPRNEGIDATLLAKQYDLDFGLIHKYLFKYSIKPEMQGILDKKLLEKSQATKGINRFLEECTDIYLDDYDELPSPEKLCEFVNKKISTFSKGVKNGISMSAYEEVKPENLIDMGENRYGISNSYVKIVLENIAKGYANQIVSQIKGHDQFNDFCKDNNLPSVSEENMKEINDIVQEYLAKELGIQNKELGENEIVEVITQYFMKQNDKDISKVVP